MPMLSQHHAQRTTKMLLVGDSGSGKTGALASLAAAGYNLRILDADNGIDLLLDYLRNPASMYFKKDPRSIERVAYTVCSDKMRTIGGQIFPMEARAWPLLISRLEHWKEPATADAPAIDFGRLTSWTEQDILVIDSMSFTATAAHNFVLQMNGNLGGAKTPTQNEARRNIWAAQNMLRDMLAMLYDSNVKCNVIVTAHITFVNELGEKPADGQSQMQGYPSAIGRALSPHIPRYFNTVLFAKTVGSGPAARHKIYTTPQGVVNVKSSAPLSVAPEYPLETGLADYFSALRKAHDAKPASQAKPQ